MDDSPVQSTLCVIGHPIGGNPTQFVVQRALSSLGLDWQFVSFDVKPDMIERAITGIDSLGFHGVMVAEPYLSAVEAILRRLENETPPQDAEPLVSWYDCFTRDEKDRFVGHNLFANAAKQCLSRQLGEHLAIDRALWVGDPDLIADSLLPLQPMLPPYQEVVQGNQRLRWPFSVAADTEDEESDDETILPTECTVPIPLLMIWALPLKPSKKLPGKANPRWPSSDFLFELLTQLHTDSIVFDLAGTYQEWASAIASGESIPATIVSGLDLEVERLMLAIRLWTGQLPSAELIRESIEEYLEV